MYDIMIYNVATNKQFSLSLALVNTKLLTTHANEYYQFLSRQQSTLAMRLLEEVFCAFLRYENCQKILSCTLQYVTCPSKNTVISFFLLFAKEDKKK
jgi:hypothetical protein